MSNSNKPQTRKQDQTRERCRALAFVVRPRTSECKLPNSDCNDAANEREREETDNPVTKITVVGEGVSQLRAGLSNRRLPFVLALNAHNHHHNDQNIETNKTSRIRPWPQTRFRRPCFAPYRSVRQPCSATPLFSIWPRPATNEAARLTPVGFDPERLIT